MIAAEVVGKGSPIDIGEGHQVGVPKNTWSFCPFLVPFVDFTCFYGVGKMFCLFHLVFFVFLSSSM